MPSWRLMNAIRKNRSEMPLLTASPITMPIFTGPPRSSIEPSPLNICPRKLNVPFVMNHKREIPRAKDSPNECERNFFDMLMPRSHLCELVSKNGVTSTNFTSEFLSNSTLRVESGFLLSDTFHQFLSFMMYLSNI